MNVEGVNRMYVRRYKVGVSEMQCEGRVKVLVVMGGVRFDHEGKSTNNMYCTNQTMTRLVLV